MDINKKDKIGGIVRESRAARGVTQQELSDLTGISQRSIQRIENGDVLPRLYTLKILAQHLNFVWEPSASSEVEEKMIPQVKTVYQQAAVQRFNKAQKTILTIGVAIVIVSLVSAYIFQSPTFPETHFEAALLWAAVAMLYTIILFVVWQ